MADCKKHSQKAGSGRVVYWIFCYWFKKFVIYLYSSLNAGLSDLQLPEQENHA